MPGFEGPIDHCGFLVLIPNSSAGIGDPIGGICTLSLVPAKTTLLMGLEIRVLLSSSEGSSIVESSISAIPMPFESNFSHECLFSAGKLLGDLGWAASHQMGFLKGKKRLVRSKIEVGIITGSASVGRPLEVKALNPGELRKDVIGFVFLFVEGDGESLSHIKACVVVTLLDLFLSITNIINQTIFSTPIPLPSNLRLLEVFILYFCKGLSQQIHTSRVLNYKNLIYFPKYTDLKSYQTKRIKRKIEERKGRKKKKKEINLHPLKIHTLWGLQKAS
uniref:Uncharacterized protein n=1 Tax=Rhizophora mucronata TaxID=61149 RepID=A0A2P2P3K5_RHIMU